MSRYVDVDAYKDALVDYFAKCTITKYRINMLYGPPHIDDMPSVDIVRCEECRFWETDWKSSMGADYHYCPKNGRPTPNEFYCADAERRADDE